MIRVICSVICLAAVFAGNSKPPNDPNNGRDWNHYLAKRATYYDDDFFWFDREMSTLACVVTGVSLEIGILDSSIPIDEVAAEMLNIGDVKLEDVVAFNKNTLTDFLTQMQNLATDLNSRSEDINSEIMAMSPMKELWKKAGNVTNILKKDNFAVLKGLATEESDLLLKKNLTNSTVLLNAQKGDMKALLTPLSEVIEGIEIVKGRVNVDEILDFLKTLQPLAYYRMLLDSVEHYSNYYTVQNLTPDFKTAMEADFQKMKSISQVRENWKFIADIVSHPTTRSKKKYTSGLIMNVLYDLDQISNQLKAPEFDGKVPELKNLLSLKDKLITLTEKWQPIANSKTFHNIELFDRVRENLISLRAASGDISTTIDSFAQCPKVVINNDMRNAAYTVSSFITSTADIITTRLRAFKDLFTLVNENQKAIVKQAMIDGSGVEKVVELMKRMEPSLELLEIRTDGLKNSAERLYIFDYYQDILDKTVKPREFLDCISTNVYKKDAKAFIVASIATDLRKITQEMIDSVNAAAQAISDSIPTIKEIRNITKNVQKDQSARLMKLKGFQTKAKEFGDAVTVVDMVRKASISPETLLEASNVPFSMMERIMIEAKDLKVLDSVASYWRNGKEDTNDVKALQVQIEILKLKVKKPAAGNETFSKYASLFTEFSNLRSVNLKTKERLAALDPLIDVVGDQGLKNYLEDYQSKLQLVADLDLDFARYSSALNNVANTLLELDYAVANGQKAPSTPAPGSPGSPGSPGGPGGAGAGGASAAALGGSSGGSDNTLIIVGVVVGVLVILGVIIGVVVYLKKKKSSAKKKGSTSKSKPPGKDSAETNDPKSPGDDNGASPASPNPDGKEGGSKDVGASKEGGSKEKGSNEKIKGSKELV